MRGFIPPRYRRQVTHTRGLATALGFAFGVDDSTVCRASRRVEPLLAGVFRIPERKVELSHDEIRELFFDATERPTNRLGRGRRAFDSGKKRHAIERQVVVVRKKKKKKPGRGRKPRRLRVACVSRSFAGSTHDKRVYDRAGVVIPEGVPACGDAAYLGKDGAQTLKPKGQELTARQKRRNRRTRRRLVVAGVETVKVGRAAADRSRSPRRHTRMFKEIAGPHKRTFTE